MGCETCSTHCSGAASRAAASRDHVVTEDLVDLLVTNANVLTMNGREASASAVAIHAGTPTAP
jgi:hypothetical protein